MAQLQPQRFGKYILLRRIALGGMAEIFKAKVAGAGGFEKDIVIKRILPQFGEDESFTRMFVDEARLTAKLQHQNIVQIFDFDVLDDRYFIAMEYIEGKDLKDVLERSDQVGDPLSVPQCVYIAMEVARGLHYAHTKEEGGQPLGIVHRDVTPSNVMVSYRGDVKLMDFGIAKASQQTTKTQAGAVKGKVAYMAPEQAHGKAVDARTDIFGLGVVLWEMLTYKRLFLANSDFETLTNIVRLDVEPPSTVNRRVPAELDAIVLKCLEKDPAKRWLNMEVLGRELSRWYYANVPDLDKEKLKPLMVRLFKHEIDEAERLAEAERVEILGLPAAPMGATESTRHDARHRTGSNPVMPASGAGEPTRSDYHSPTATVPGPIMREDTRVEASVLDGLPSTVLEATAPNYRDIPLSGRTMVGSLPERPRRVNWGLVVVLTLVCVGAGVGLAFVLWPAAPAPETATVVPPVSTPAPERTAVLIVSVTPEAAKVRVDGELVDGIRRGLGVGDVVRVVAEAPGYKRHEAFVTIDGPEVRTAVTLVPEAVPQRIVIRPSADTDEVFVDDRRLGTGAQFHESEVGKKVRVRVVPASGAAPIEREVVVGPDSAIVEVRTPGKVLITVTPPESEVSASEGKVVRSGPGLFELSGVIIGEPTTLTTRSPGFRDDSRTIVVRTPRDNLAITLEKSPATATVGVGSPPPRQTNPTATEPRQPATTPPRTEPRTTTPNPQPPQPAEPVATANGSLSITAAPGATVTVNGRPRGSTPVSLSDLAPGTYSIVLSRGARVEKRSVRVEAGQEAKVFVDFSE